MNDGRPPRVLVSAETFLPAVNGVTNSVLRVIEHLDRCGLSVCVLTPGAGSGKVRLASGTRVRVHRVRGMSVPRYRSLQTPVAVKRHVAEIIDDFRPDLVHLAAPVVLGRTVGKLASVRGIPTVALFQTDLSGFLRDYGLGAMAAPTWAWLRQIHNRADLTLAPTRVIADALTARNFERVAVWGRGVDHVQFDPARRSAAFREAVGAGPDDVLVGYVGRLAAEKRVDRLRHLAGLPGVRLAVVGDGPQRAQLERQLPSATFVGFRSGVELGAAMASLDVFVHTGERETFGQTLQEAMAAGVAVVAPAAGGPLSLVEPGVTGMLYAPDDGEALRHCVARLVADPQHRAQIASAGRRSVASRSWRAVGDELVGHYARLLGTAAEVAA